MRTDRLSGYNPLRGLTLEGYVSMLEQGERGYYADLAWLYRLVLRRNGTARAVRRKLTAAIGRLDWNIKVPEDLEGARKELAERQAEALRKAYDRVTNLRAAYTHLAFADIMGFAHLNKVYAGAGEADPWAVKELRIVEQWHLCRDGLFAPWTYNREATSTNRGEPIDPKHWIWREVDDPAAEIFTFAHLKMGMTDADWDQFSDSYAVPSLFIEGPPNVRREDEARYQDVAERTASDGRGYLPNGSKPHVVNSGTDGVSVFTERLRYYREEIVLAGTSGILTTLDGNTGIGKGPADEHGDAWLDLAAAVAMEVSEAMQGGFDAPELERLFPGEERLAYFELEKPEGAQDPATLFTAAKAAKDAGFAVDAEELSERSGWTLAAEITTPEATAPGTATKAPPAPGEQKQPPPSVDPAAPQGQGGGPKVPPPSARGEADAGLVQAALANDLGLEERWLDPVAAVFAEIERMLADPAVPIADVEAKLQEAIAQMPELLGQVNVNELAQALENAAGPAALQGLAEGLRAKIPKTGV